MSLSGKEVRSFRFLNRSESSVLTVPLAFYGKRRVSLECRWIITVSTDPSGFHSDSERVRPNQTLNS